MRLGATARGHYSSHGAIAARRRRALPLALVALLLAGAAPDEALSVTVQVSGAVTRSGSYTHAADVGYGCWALRVWVLSRPGAPAEHSPAQWEISFAAGSEPPAASFHLSFPMEGDGSKPPVRAASVRMTAAGRLWEGGAGVDGMTAEIHPDPGHRSGRFLLRGLRVAGGGAERIDVAGTWRCPPPP